MISTTRAQAGAKEINQECGIPFQPSPINSDFPDIGWTEKLQGSLQENGTVKFSKYNKLVIELNVPEYSPAAGYPGSWHKSEGCAFANWKANETVTLSVLRIRDRWTVFIVENRTRGSDRASLPVLPSHVHGWSETFQENKISAQPDLIPRIYS